MIPKIEKLSAHNNFSFFLLNHAYFVTILSIFCHLPYKRHLLVRKVVNAKDFYPGEICSASRMKETWITRKLWMTSSRITVTHLVCLETFICIKIPVSGYSLDFGTILFWRYCPKFAKIQTDMSYSGDSLESDYPDCSLPPSRLTTFFSARRVLGQVKITKRELCSVLSKRYFFFKLLNS